MIKKWLIEQGLKFLMGAIALGIGIWYLSSSIGGASLSYTSVDAFMQQIGAGNGDVSSVNGCFLCVYIGDLFAVLGRATEMFWNGIVHNLWILMAIGFGIFIIFHTFQFINEQAKSKDIKDLSNKEIKLDFKKWFEKVWKTGMRVLIAGALIGALNWSGTSTLKVVTNVTVAPVMYLGSTLSSSFSAREQSSAASCSMFSARSSLRTFSVVFYRTMSMVALTSIISTPQSEFSASMRPSRSSDSSTLTSSETRATQRRESTLLRLSSTRSTT